MENEWTQYIMHNPVAKKWLQACQCGTFSTTKSNHHNQLYKCNIQWVLGVKYHVCCPNHKCTEPKACLVSKVRDLWLTLATCKLYVWSMTHLPQQHDFCVNSRMSAVWDKWSSSAMLFLSFEVKIHKNKCQFLSDTLSCFL